MGFQLIPKSVPLNDLERRHGRVVSVISPNSLAFGTYYVKWLKISRYILRVKCSRNNLVFSDISLMTIFVGNRPSVKVKRLHVASENLTYNQP